jgi:hypothetical protein
MQQPNLRGQRASSRTPGDGASDERTIHVERDLLRNLCFT